jgi:hypothetical protein
LLLFRSEGCLQPHQSHDAGTEFDERVPTLLRVFGAPVDVDAPPTPFALGPEIDGADFDLRGQGSPGQHL